MNADALFLLPSSFFLLIINAQKTEISLSSRFQMDSQTKNLGMATLSGNKQKKSRQMGICGNGSRLRSRSAFLAERPTAKR
jgi:hypothetical protein